MVLILCIYMSVMTTLGDTSANLLYGGILNDIISINGNDPGIKNIAQLAFEHVQKFHPDTVPKTSEGHFLEPSISSANKVKLQCTSDNQSPLYYQEISHTPNGEKFQKKKAILGITYNFSLVWDTPTSFMHRFIVTVDRGRNIFIYSHTFLRSQSRCQSPSQTSSQSDCPVPNSLDRRSGSEGGEERIMALDVPTCSPATVSPPHTKYSEGMRSLTALTYNIWNYNQIGSDESYYSRMKKLGKLISNPEADIIAFQEVRFDFSKTGATGPSQVDLLRGHLPQYQFVFQPAMSYPKDFVGRIEEGVAIFSKYPIKSYDHILLSRNLEDETDSHQRICLHAEIDIPWKENVHVFVTHFSLSEYTRDKNVVEIWKYIQRYSGPALLMGDLNAEPSERSMKFLRGEVEINGTHTRGLLKDSWLIFNKEPRPDAPGKYRKDEAKDDGLTFDLTDHDLRKRIDYIYIRRSDSVDVKSVSLLDDKGRRLLAASDHLGVLAVLEPKHDTS